MNTTNAKYENKVKGPSVYEIITDRIVEQLSKGIVPWHKPWVGGSAMAVKYRNGEPYSMLNQLLLGKPGEWLSWKQIQDLGGRIKKGSKGRICVWTKTEDKITINDETNEESVETKRYLKWYRVWHIDDCEGIPTKLEPVVANPNLVPLDEAEKVINAYVEREIADGFSFVNNHESGSAYYSPSQDMVVVPMLTQYEDAEEYYSTTFHEFVHSTMKASRCNRVADNKITSFGDKDYSREELVAEIGSAMLCNRTGIEIEKTFKNSVAYIQNWLKALKNDTHMISWAASRAEKASKYILNEVQNA